MPMIKKRQKRFDVREILIYFANENQSNHKLITMKKNLYALMALTAAGVMTLSAAEPAALRGYGEFTVNPEAVSKIQKNFAEMKAALDAGMEVPNSIKRVYVDRTGNIWEANFLLDETPLCDILVFTGPNGEEIKYSFDELPFYQVASYLYKYDQNGQNVVSSLPHILAWPCMYMWQQLSEWDPNDPRTVWTTEDGKQYWDIPENLKDYSVVDFEALANTPELGHLFQESGFIGAVEQDSSGVFTTWSMLPNQQLGIASTYEGVQGYTVLSNTVASTISINAYDAAEGVMSVAYRDYLNIDNTNRTVSVAYDGTGRLEGFHPESRSFNLGELHIFNTGVSSSDIFGVANPYTEDFEPVQRYVMWGVGDKIDMIVAPGAWNESKTVQLSAERAQSLDDLNYFKGSIYSNVGEAPEGMWSLLEPVEAYDPLWDEWYNSIRPTPGYFVSAGWNGEWATLDGLLLFYHDNGFVPTGDSKIGVGMQNGSGLALADTYGNVYNVFTTDKVFYHPDETDASKVETLNAVGDLAAYFLELGSNGVAGVVADSQLNVTAANGAISVVPAEGGNVAVYSLNGTLVKSAYVAAGETLNVEVAKGLYIVVAGKNAAKVVL